MMAWSPRCYIQSCRFWKRRFFKVFTIYGHDGHLGHETWTINTNFRSLFPRRLHIKFGFDWPSGFRGEDFLKWWTTTTMTDARAWAYYKLTYEPFGSGELKMKSSQHMGIFFPFTYKYIVEVRQKLILKRKPFFSFTLFKIFMVIFQI